MKMLSSPSLTTWTQQDRSVATAATFAVTVGNPKTFAVTALVKQTNKQLGGNMFKRYTPFNDVYEAITAFENGEIETLEQATAVAIAILDTGLINSAGRYGRFCELVQQRLQEQDEINV